MQRIRNSFDAKELNVIRWIRGTGNISDALTKRNYHIGRRMNEMLMTGLMIADIGLGCEVDKHGW